MEKKQLPLDELTKIAADDYAAYAFAARLEQVSWKLRKI